MVQKSLEKMLEKRQFIFLYFLLQKIEDEGHRYYERYSAPFGVIYHIKWKKNKIDCGGLCKYPLQLSKVLKTILGISIEIYLLPPKYVYKLICLGEQ